MIRLDAATVLLQWSVGGLLFLWITSRRREVGIGYGWLLRATYGSIAVGAIAAGFVLGTVPVREVSSAAVVVAASAALVVSVVRRKAGVAGERARQAARAERVAAMTSTADVTPATDADPDETDQSQLESPGTGNRSATTRVFASAGRSAEFPPNLDLVAPLVGVVGLVAAALDAGGPAPLAIARTLVGAAFLGAISDAMLLGHWYLVQPGLARGPLLELVRWLGWLWPVEVGLLVWPTGMVSAITGTVDDGAGGLLTWFWVACASTTLGLVFVTRAALRERAYSAVMAATGLLYLGILTGFGTDLVARAILA